MIIEDEDGDAMKSRVCCLECDWGGWLVRMRPPLAVVFIGSYGCFCSSHGENTGQTRRFCMTTLTGLVGGTKGVPLSYPRPSVAMKVENKDPWTRTKIARNGKTGC